MYCLKGKQLKKVFVYLFILNCQLFTLIAIAQENPAQWEFEPKGKTVAIADVHADPHALLSALMDRKIIDETGKFIAKDMDIVFTGDFADKGPNTRGVWDILHYLETNAENSNCRIHTLMGNHDTAILMGNTQRMFAEDLKKFSKFDPDPIKGVKRALVSPPYEEMMSNWKAIVKIGNTVFTHAGLDDWVLETPPEEANKILQDYIKARQDYLKRSLAGENVLPPSIPKLLEAPEWGTKGELPNTPFWSRKLAYKELSNKKFKKLMDFVGAKYHAVGHTPTKSSEIEFKYKGRLILLDTGASESYGGKISAVTFNPDESIESHNNITRVKNKKLFKYIKQTRKASCFENLILQHQLFY